VLLVPLADLVLFVHIVVIIFNLFGLIVIPLGAWRRWTFVRIFWWRALHLVSLGIVALQALFGRACFLTLWQDALMHPLGEVERDQPLIQRWVMTLIFWHLPLWTFTTLYVLLWIYLVILWWKVPPRGPWSGSALSNR